MGYIKEIVIHTCNIFPHPIKECCIDIRTFLRLQISTWLSQYNGWGGLGIHLLALEEAIRSRSCVFHDDVIKWKHFPRNWPFVRVIHRSPVNSPRKGQWRGALMFSLFCARINGWVNNREAGDLRRHPTHCDVIVMLFVSYIELRNKRLNNTPLFTVLISKIIGDSLACYDKSYSTRSLKQRMINWYEQIGSMLIQVNVTRMAP